MAQPVRAFEPVPDEPIPDNPPPAAGRIESAAMAALFLFLKTLSQRTLIALADLFTLITVALVFWLWWAIIAKPTIEQIAALTIFSVFVIGVNLIVRRR